MLRELFEVKRGYSWVGEGCPIHLGINSEVLTMPRRCEFGVNLQQAKS